MSFGNNNSEESISEDTPVPEGMTAKELCNKLAETLLDDYVETLYRTGNIFLEKIKQRCLDLALKETHTNKEEAMKWLHKNMDFKEFRNCIVEETDSFTSGLAQRIPYWIDWMVLNDFIYNNELDE